MAVLSLLSLDDSGALVGFYVWCRFAVVRGHAAVGFHPLDSLLYLSRRSLMHRKPLTMRPFRVALLIAIRHAACYLLHHVRELATPVA